MNNARFVIILLFSLSARAGVEFNQFLEVKHAMHLAFHELKSNSNEKLYINRITPGLSKTYWWDVDLAHASYVRTEANQVVEHNIYLMGGLARMEEMSPEGLLLIACHELGHGVGGNPRKVSSLSSTEGQADYFATKECLPIAMKFLKARSVFQTKQSYSAICSSQSKHETELCFRMVFSLESEIAVFRSSGGVVDLNSYSTNVAEELNLSPSYYPKAQCRLDTMINGILGIERPECWYPGGSLGGTLR